MRMLASSRRKKIPKLTRIRVSITSPRAQSRRVGSGRHFIPFELMRLACPLRQRHLIANQWFSNDERSLNMFALRRRREPPRKYRNSTGLNRGSETQMSNNEDLKVELEKLRDENEELKN